MSLVIQVILPAINAFHLIGVAHRDISCNNILCQRDDDSVRSFIIDFDNASYVNPDTGYRDSSEMQIGRKASITVSRPSHLHHDIVHSSIAVH